MSSKRNNELPGSLKRRSAAEMLQVPVVAEQIEVEAAQTIDSADFRVQAEKSEMVGRADRLREAVKGAGGNKAVSARSGVPGSTLSDYLAGQDWKFSSAMSLAITCQVSLDWLAGFEGRQTHIPAKPDIVFNGGSPLITVEAKNYAFVPRYDVKASAGVGNEIVEERITGNIALEENFFRENIGVSRDSIVTIRAEGDSMDPTIRDGDLLFVDTSVQEVQNSRIYVLNVNDRLLVKRVQLRVDGSFVIKSDNPRYDPEIIIPSERAPLRIIGRVVYQAGPVRS